jgi:hypothetical protein
MTERSYDELVEQLYGSIYLGYDAESGNPDFSYEMPSENEMRWLAHFLASEGWTRSS